MWCLRRQCWRARSCCSRFDPLHALQKCDNLTLQPQKREGVAALADEVDDLKWGIQEEEDKQEQAAVSARALQLQQSVELAAVAAAIEAEEGRCSGAEKLLFCIESRLADLNDKFEREAIEAPLPHVPVRQVVREPEARSASEAATRALQHRLQKLIGCRCVCLCVCVLE